METRSVLARTGKGRGETDYKEHTEIWGVTQLLHILTVMEATVANSMLKTVIYCMRYTSVIKNAETISAVLTLWTQQVPAWHKQRCKHQVKRADENHDHRPMETPLKCLVLSVLEGLEKNPGSLRKLGRKGQNEIANASHEQ